MDRKRIDLLWLAVSIVSYLLMAVMFLLMPIDNMVPSLKDSRIIVIVGIGFWVFLILGIAAQVILSGRRKAWYRTQHINEKRSSVRRVGLISFFSNKIAVVADIAMVISLIGLVASVIITKATGYTCYVFLAIFSFSFCLHCILNGKVYYHVTHHYESNGKYERNAHNERKKVEGEQ